MRGPKARRAACIDTGLLSARHSGCHCTQQVEAGRSVDRERLDHAVGRARLDAQARRQAFTAWPCSELTLEAACGRAAHRARRRASRRRRAPSRTARSSGASFVARGGRGGRRTSCTAWCRRAAERDVGLLRAAADARTAACRAPAPAGSAAASRRRAPGRAAGSRRARPRRSGSGARCDGEPVSSTPSARSSSVVESRRRDAFGTTSGRQPARRTASTYFLPQTWNGWPPSGRLQAGTRTSGLLFDTEEAGAALIELAADRVFLVSGLRWACG